MSYLENKGFYTNEPSAYVRPDFNSRVPGWGPVRQAAGPSMWGVGTLATMPAAKRTAAMRLSPALASRAVTATPIKGGTTDGGAAATTESGGIPWWVWVAVPMAGGGLGLIAWDMGWFGD